MNLRYYSTGQFERFNCSIYSHKLNELPFKTILFSRKPDRVIATQNNQDFGNRTAAHQT